MPASAKAAAPDSTAPRTGEVGHLRHGDVGNALAASQHPHRPLGKIPRPVEGGQHHRPAAVHHQTAVQQVEGGGDHRRGEHIVYRDRPCSVPVCLGVEQRPFPRRRRDLGQLLPGGSVLVEVALGRQGIEGEGAQHPVGRLVLVGGGVGLDHPAQPAGCGRPLVGTVRDQRRPAAPRTDGVHRRPDHQLEGRPPFHGGAHPGGLHPPVLGHGGGAEPLHPGGGQAVHIGHLQPGVRRRRQGGLGLELVDGAPRYPQIRLADPHDRRLSAGHAAPSSKPAARGSVSISNSFRSSVPAERTGQGSPPS